VPTAGWRCVKVLVDGAPGNPMPGRLTDYIGVEFYAHYEDAPEWYKQATTIMMKSRRDSIAHLLDSLKSALDANAPKKP
jgi:hypothetical protein